MIHPTHSQCAYYANGFCTLRGVQVPPDAPACPNFTPRIAPAPTPAQPQMAAYPQPPSRWPMPGFRPLGLGLMLRRRRRLMHRLRYGWRRR
ncbi:MAG: hypothetical protein J7L17_03180 [Thaumarchaeota archaeon]|nr:hypothetical protein [Nitrososphaerota archaeon]